MYMNSLFIFKLNQMKEQIAEAIGTSVEYSSDHLLDTHASRIRMKIKEITDVKVLHAVRGVGYRLLSN